MREFKFRYYDPRYNMMCYCDSPSVFIGMEGGAYEKVEKSGFGTRWDEYEKEESYILLQYTGLKDGNGMEIYEGDIVQFEQRNLEKAFGYDGSGDMDYTKHKRTIKWGVQAFNVPGGFIKNLEVIGNIYQNPELLQSR